MPRRKRTPFPPGRVAVLALAVPGAAVIALDHGFFFGFALVAVVAAVAILPWLLMPYSKTAARIVLPSDQAFARGERVAARLRSLPLVGVVFRGAERLSNNPGHRSAEEYRRWARQQEERPPGE